MPTTSHGLRYPASSAAPNVPQDIQNLATDIDNNMEAKFFQTNFPSSFVSGTNNIATSTLSINPGIGGYVLCVTVSSLITAAGTATPRLEVLIAGAVKLYGEFTGVTSTNKNFTQCLARNFHVPDGTSRTVFARVVAPAGTDVTTYNDDAHSYLNVTVIPA